MVGIELYLKQVLPRLARKLRDGARPPQLNESGYTRALLLLEDAALTFLTQMDIVAKETPPGSDSWASGSEIWVPHLFFEDGKLMRHYELRNSTGGELSEFQRILALELQSEVLLYLDSIGSEGDDLLDISASSFARYPVARAAMHVAGRDSWQDGHL